MMLAAPGQLVAVSKLADDPLSSVMVEQARGYAKTMGQAEQVYLMHPDLVLAGTYTSRASVALLRRLGVEVVELAPASRLSDVTDHILTVGAALGREPEARALADGFAADLAADGD